MTTSPNVFSSDDESNRFDAAVPVHHTANAGESELLEKMTELIKGIAPSSCKLTCAEMWGNIQRHKDLLQLPKIEFPVFESTPKVYYLNSNDGSERIAELSMKLQAKFVPSETTSSYSIWAESSRQFANAFANRRPFNGVSPGRRLSHLAKRRQMFSKANLQQLAQNEPKNLRLAIKTMGQRNIDLRPHLQPTIPKRALFQSPDEPPVRPGFQTVAKQVPRRRLFADLNKNGPVQELPHGGGSYDVSSWLASQPFINNRKRAREDSLQETNPKRRCPRRSLDFSDASPSQASQISSHSSSTPILTMTNVHKQKLLWAVATALKEKQITHKHQKFKEHAKKLFTHCRKNLATILTLQVPSGTTDKMLSYARQHIENIITSSDEAEAPRAKILIAGGKENVNRTPKRVTKPRTWRSCVKSRQKHNSLNRSLSCDDLKENISYKRKRESIDDSRRVFREIRNTKRNEPEISTTAVIIEPPEIDDCVQASQEETESRLFPALVRNVPMPKSPDLFDCDEPDVSFPSLEIPPQSNFLETMDESACPENMTELLDLSCVRNENTELLDLSYIRNENTECGVEDNTNANELLSDDEQQMCKWDHPEDMTDLLDLSCIRNENTEMEISSTGRCVEDKANESDEGKICEAPFDDTTDLLDLRCVRNENTEQEISSIHIEADVEDNVNANESDGEGNMCTSTPMVSVPKRILRRNKPAWKVETGPGLKIRVRLSKEWDIVGRRAHGISLESTNPEIDLKEPAVETQIKNPFMRLTSVDTTGSSTDTYNLMELRDKLQIEQTLAADPSDLSFFESSPNSLSNPDTPTQDEVSTIVEVSPEITINCYSRKPFSVFEPDSSDSEDEQLTDNLKEQINPVESDSSDSEDEQLTDNLKEQINPVVESDSSDGENEQLTDNLKEKINPVESDSSDGEDEPVTDNSKEKINPVESDSSESEDEQDEKNESDDENVPLSQLLEPNADSPEENLPLIRLIDPNLGNTQVSDTENLSQLTESKLDKTDIINLAEQVSEDENLPLSLLAAHTTKQEADSEDDLPLSQLPVQKKKLSLETYKARRSSSVSSEGGKKIYNIRLKRKIKTSNDENANPAQDVHATIENSERIIQQTFAEFSCMIHQKMQSTITDSSDFESKIEKLNKLVEMNIVQQQLFSYFKEKTLEIREKLSPLRLKD